MTVRSSNIAVLGVLVVAALCMGYVFANYSYNVQGGFLVFMVVVIASFFFIRRMSRVETAKWFLVILILGLALKLISALTRMSTNILVYGGLYDAGRYDRNGTHIASAIWRMDFAEVAPFIRVGTPFMDFWSGVSHTITGPTVIGSYLVFSVLAFTGSFFFYRAFRVAFPYGNRLFYALLAFFYPSVLYWSNGLGKDAWLSLCLGLSAYGGALVLRRGGFSGLLPLAIGLYGAYTVRPHVAGMIGIALLAAFLLGKASSKGILPQVYRVAIVVAGVFLIWYFMPTILHKSGIGELSLDPSAFETTASYFDKRQRSTGGGGSAFAAPSFTDPLFVPKAVGTILYRPFLWEAHNPQALIQALDAVLLLGLTVWRAPAIARALMGFRSNPYVIFILVYTVLLSVALMTVANFGTLARERAMLLPFVFMLVVAEPPKRQRLAIQEAT